MLQAAYRDLGFADGTLLDATDDPSEIDDSVWLEKGDWLKLAKTVGAEKVFFVDDNPVIVFASSDTDDPERLRTFFNGIWCMARPQLLFLASPGELNVLDMTAPPVRPAVAVSADSNSCFGAKRTVVSERIEHLSERSDAGSSIYYTGWLEPSISHSPFLRFSLLPKRNVTLQECCGLIGVEVS